VEPPGAVQQLRQALAKHHPQLSLISPLDGSQLKGGPLNLELKIEDWPLANDRELGLGAHVAIQMDDQAPIRVSEQQGNRLTLELPSLSPEATGSRPMPPIPGEKPSKHLVPACIGLLINCGP
jgi:hypothetical protein